MYDRTADSGISMLNSGRIELPRRDYLGEDILPPVLRMLTLAAQPIGTPLGRIFPQHLGYRPDGLINSEVCKRLRQRSER